LIARHLKSSRTKPGYEEEQHATQLRHRNILDLAQKHRKNEQHAIDRQKSIFPLISKQDYNGDHHPPSLPHLIIGIENGSRLTPNLGNMK
jgi:hypothetical protein